MSTQWPKSPIALAMSSALALAFSSAPVQAIYTPWEGSFHQYPDSYYDVDGQLVEEAYEEPEQVPGNGLSPWDPADAIKRTSPEHQNYPLSDLTNQGGWTMVEELSDEFDSPQFNEYNLMGKENGKWLPNNHIWGGRAPAVFAPKNVKQEGGKLHLSIANDESYTPHGFWNEWYYGWTSASVQNVNPIRYGYFEVKSKVGIGSSGFWLYAETLEDKEYLSQFNEPGHVKSKLELDVYEQSGRRSEWAPYYNMNSWVFIHQGEEMSYVNEEGNEYTAYQNGGHWKADIDFADDFHVYGFYWGPEEITWYFDGKPIRSMKNRYYHTPLYLLLDTETMPDWFGMPSANELDFAHQIEYVRVWTNDETEQNWRGRYFMDPTIKTGDGLNGKPGENRVAAEYGGTEAYREKWGNPVSGSPEVVTLQGIAAKQSHIEIQSDIPYVLVPQFTPSNVTDKQMNWLSSDPSIADINRSGMVSAKAAGSVTFTGSHADLPNQTISVTADILQIGKRFDLELVNYGATGKEGDEVENDNVYGWGVGNGVVTFNTRGDYGDFFDVDFGSGGTYMAGISAGTDIASGIGATIFIDGVEVLSGDIASSGNWNVNKRTDLAGSFEVAPGTHTVRIMSSGSSGWQWNGARAHFVQVLEGDIDPGDGGTDPGDGGTDPGDGGTDPGDGGTDPGDGGTDPGDGGTDPGDGGTDPGDGGTDPGDGGTDPGDGGTDPTAVTLQAQSFVATGGANGGFEVYDIAGGQGINFNQTGDYADYTVNLAAGSYSVSLYAATPMNDAGAELILNGESIAVSSISPTGGWDNFQSRVITANLVVTTDGEQALRLISVGADNAWQWNADKLVFTPNSDNGATNPDPTPGEVVISVEAESFTDTGGSYDGFLVYAINGGSAINFNQAGDYADYLVTIEQAGTYSMSIEAGTNLANTGIEVWVDGESQASSAIANTGSWDVFASNLVSNNISLSEGQHTIRIMGVGEAGSWQWNADKFTLTKQ
ncbi:carbohydrate-binding protein [Agarivorans sp. B2Z047]|uniref:carbohydrate-binding protein n=1 Tax=Agarivorans sp. B2Z047 TaxID=2652721 RepID=UPI00128D0649|nr:carbohydrate-binding protein [Agarivorans sp. B2Z047]MPW27547.1 carbohydrate-binding protein [Agarivorans sp. B2Z047]UQN44612.1 carbohydrate-binding protein [Agarivorans sp. B2Z047]